MMQFGDAATTNELPLRLVVSALRSWGTGSSIEPSDSTEPALLAATRLAAAARILPQFAQGASTWNRSDAHRSMLAAVEAFKRRAVVQNSALLAQYRDVDATLRRSSIPYAIVKGPLQQLSIHGDLFVRPSGDVDLLVGSEHFQAAFKELLGAGFLPTNRSPFSFWNTFVGERHLRKSTTQWSLDLHHRLQPAGCPQPRQAERFLSEREEMRMAGRSFPVLRRDFIPVLSAMSLVKALRRREPFASHVVDIFAAVGGNPAALVDNAQAFDLTGTARVALRIVSAIIPLPDQHHAALRESVLPRYSDIEICRLAIAPHEAPSSPSMRELLAAACGDRRLRYAQELGWYGLSELARKLERLTRLLRGERLQ